MTYTDAAKNKKFSIFTCKDWETKTDIRLSNNNKHRVKASCKIADMFDTECRSTMLFMKFLNRLMRHTDVVVLFISFDIVSLCFVFNNKHITGRILFLV